MRTLKIMLRVYARELRETLQLDDRRLDCLFPQLDSLLELHSHFLSCLRERRTESLQPGSDHNYAIHKISDILISQVHALNLVPYFLLHLLSFISCLIFPVITLLPYASPLHISCLLLPASYILLSDFCPMLPASHFLPYISCFILLSHFFPKLPTSPFLSYTFCFKYPVVTLSPHTFRCCKAQHFLLHTSGYHTFAHISCCCHTFWPTFPTSYFLLSHFFPKLPASSSPSYNSCFKHPVVTFPALHFLAHTSTSFLLHHTYPL